MIVDFLVREIVVLDMFLRDSELQNETFSPASGGVCLCASNFSGYPAAKNT
jgi:hypothetical protein